MHMPSVEIDIVENRLDIIAVRNARIYYFNIIDVRRAYSVFFLFERRDFA